MVTLKLTARLTDVDGNPLPNKTIEFYVSTDNVNFTLIDTRTTDSNGTAETIYEAEEPGTYYFKARFPGDDMYEPSEAVTSYTVEAAPTPAPTPFYKQPWFWLIIFVLIMILFGAGRRR